MKVWLVRVPFGDTVLTDQLYEDALLCVDEESRARVRRFYHREDRWRCLIGRILPRILLADRGIQPNAVKISTTSSGKPYIESPVLDPPLSYNVTHDSGYVAMAFESKSGNEGGKIGVDIMKTHIPAGETAASFTAVLSDQLTQPELDYLALHVQDPDALTELLFKYWTMKEAYTKALGIGLGFNFQRVECRMESAHNREGCSVSVDGKPLLGWNFQGFHYVDGSDHYLGMVATASEDRGVVVSWTELSRCEWVEEVRLLDLLERALPVK
ncbi:copper chaperone of lysine biosynthesis protein [Tulasnella sp. 331]|nr:copper chaperone of lysine biosynthesis protein [Tulasnella sp. 331]KAG8880444.1 copper chaperone of lysine biosynthesis protein [Tulasnella sp. 332]